MPSAKARMVGSPKDEVASINKFLRDTIKQIDDMEKKKRQLKLLITPRKMTAKLGVFSKHIYRGGQHRQGSPQLDNMAHLPTEIVHLILRLLGNPDKVALALTSKRHMALVESARKVSAKRLAVTKTRRLAVLVRLHDWMPPGLKLCYSCIKFIPSVENGPWHGDFTFLEKGLASKTALENGPHCNSCYRRDQVELAKASTNAQRLKKKVREM